MKALEAPQLLFLKAVEDTEIFDIFRKCKNKKSTDFNDIDRTLVKELIVGIDNNRLDTFLEKHKLSQFGFMNIQIHLINITRIKYIYIYIYILGL